MSERKYAFGYNGQRLTKAELEQRAQWVGLHPELRRRLLAMFDAAQDTGTDLGIGGGARSTASQTALFLSRYDSVMYPTAIRWDGRWWKKKPNVASAAPPGRSYHEPTVGQFAVAADLIGDLQWMKSVCDKFGLLEFSQVNSEPWHVQPVEFPKARSLYRGQTMKVWPLPTGPVVRPVRATLKAPVRHSDVAVLQRALNALSGAKLIVDGAMSSGGPTEVSVKNWQRFFGMTVDGVVGPKTWEGIYAVAAAKGYRVV